MLGKGSKEIAERSGTDIALTKISVEYYKKFVLIPFLDHFNT